MNERLPGWLEETGNEWARKQDEAIIEAVVRWNDSEISFLELGEIVADYSYMPPGTCVDECGTSDVFVRMLDEGILTGEVYDKLMPIVTRRQFKPLA